MSISSAVRRFMDWVLPDPTAKARQPSLFQEGHFYSPVPDLADIRARQDVIWAPRRTLPAISFNEDAQLALLAGPLARYATEISFPVQATGDPTVYFYRNDQFPVLDAEVLYCLLRHLQPRRMIEIGSGFSSLITAHVNREHLSGELHFTCIEPFPRQFLRDGVPGITDLLVRKVQDVEPEYFDPLGENDILFIDSSHVSKVGSDVNYLFFEVLPRLKPGVYVHIHDVFLPAEYPKRWVIDEGRHWNEQYLVRAFLQFNFAFEIVWAGHLMSKYHPDAVRRVFPRFPDLGGGGSLWLRRSA